MTTWSYSSIKMFDQCPKKYYHLRVAKDIKDFGGIASQYGTDVHEAAELFVKTGAPIPPKFRFIEPMVVKLNNLPGNKHAEMKLGVKRGLTGYEPCGFFDSDVWWRGVADLVIENGELAYSVDYKTGKNAKYADTKQLDLIAGALFLHFPEVTRVKSALAYVVSGEFITKEHKVVDKIPYLNVFRSELDRLEDAHKSGVWNPNSGPLCGWCPVVSCAHHRPRK